MATQVLTSVTVSVGGTDITAYVRSLTLDYSADALDDTNMGDTTKVNIGGLKSWGGTLELTDDYADDALDEDIFALIGTTGAFSGRPTSSAVGVNNPNYNGTVLFTSMNPIKGAVGQVATKTVTFVSAGALSRSTS